MKKYKLNECTDILAGGTPSTKNEKYWNGNIPWLSVKDFGNVNKIVSETEKTITLEGFNKCPSNMLHKGDLILSARGTVGKIAMVDKDMAFNQSCFGIRTKKNICNSDFIFYWYLNNQKIFKGAQQGNVFKSVTLDFFEKTEANLPSLEIQQKIAAVLSSLDDKIALNNRINAKLEQMAKRLYEHWFVQFDFPVSCHSELVSESHSEEMLNQVQHDECAKPYKSTGGKMVWNEELKREIPEGWEVTPLKECINHINTGLNPRDNFVLGNGNIKYITVKNLTESGMIDFSNCDLIDEEARSMVHNRSDIKIGDILFASICPLGRCYLINEEPKDWYINESVFTIRPNYKNMSSQFLYNILRDEYYVRKMTQKATGSIFKGIRVDDLGKMEIVLPSKEIIDSFTAKITPLLNQQAKLQQESMKLSEMRDKLLPLLMNGQVEVK